MKVVYLLAACRQTCCLSQVVRYGSKVNGCHLVHLLYELTELLPWLYHDDMMLYGVLMLC